MHWCAAGLQSAPRGIAFGFESRIINGCRVRQHAQHRETLLFIEHARECSLSDLECLAGDFRGDLLEETLELLRSEASLLLETRPELGASLLVGRLTCRRERRESEQHR